MSKIENYNRLKNVFNECKRIVSKSDKGMVHYSRQEDVYHIVAFSFVIEGSNSHTYQKSKELAEYIGQACKEFKDIIMERALEIAYKKVEDAKRDAKEEAEEVLKEICA